MNRNEALKIMAILRGAYPQFYRGIDREEAESTVNLWAEMFASDDVRVVAAAVKSVIESDEKGFPPTIGQVKAKMRMICAPDELSEVEAWGLVAKAIRNSGYEAQEEFEKLPTLIRRIVGSPSQLRDWSQMDSDAVHSVVASNFQRSYRAKAARKKEVQALPADVRAVVMQIAGGGTMALEG